MPAWLAPAFLALQAAVLTLVNRQVPVDYMDEIFHGPQARQYCRGVFSEWHPKITTFPGLYLLAAPYGWARWAAAAASAQPLSAEAACATPYLRSLNVLLSVACLLTLQAIVSVRRHASGRGREPGAQGGAAPAWLHALALAAYPLHWFFSFLFYTDVASLLFLLLCNLQTARRRYLSASLAGAVAVLCRQTNAVWVAFLLGEAVLAELGLDGPVPVAAPGPSASGAPAVATPAAAAAAPAGTGNGNRRPRVATPAAAPPAAAGAAAAQAAGAVTKPAARGGARQGELQLALGRAWAQRARLVQTLWPLLLPPAGFAAFLVANGGAVVLGDKEAHVPVRHGAQLLYFGGWAVAVLAPLLLPTAAPQLARSVAARPAAALVVAVAGTAAAAGVARTSTLVHPYLVADNRHYVFYLWRRVLGRGAAARYGLAPVYVACWALLLGALRRRASRLWVAGFLACLAATLLPAWLLELRYFTPGVYLIALRIPPPSARAALLALLGFAAANAATLYLFLYRPYKWPDDSVARFMW